MQYVHIFKANTNSKNHHIFAKRLYQSMRDTQPNMYKLLRNCNEIENVKVITKYYSLVRLKVCLNHELERYTRKYMVNLKGDQICQSQLTPTCRP